MQEDLQKTFGQLITNLIQKQDLSRKQAKQAFVTILNNDADKSPFTFTVTGNGLQPPDIINECEITSNISSCRNRVFCIVIQFPPVRQPPSGL